MLEAAVDASSAAMARTASGRIRVDAGSDAETRHVPALREALRLRRRVHLHYVVPTRDETTERDVDPMRLARTDGHWYLEGWCHRSTDTRLFRLDRIESLEVLDVDGTPPQDARSRDLARGAFHADDADLSACIDLDEEGRWVLDYYPHQILGPGKGDRVTVTLAAADPAWVVRLVRRLGGHGRLSAPPELVDRLRDETTAALANYDDDAVTGG